MPVNYSFHLYYHIEDLEKALLEMAKIAEARDQLVDITLPNGKIIQLPFTADHFKNDPVEIKCTGYNESDHTTFDLSLLFPDNPDVKRYHEEERKKSKGTYNAPEFGVGTIYLNVFVGKKYVDLTYWACCTNMSYLFLESKGVQERFIQLARSSGALGGILDIEEIEEHRSLLDPEFKLFTPHNRPDHEEGYFCDWNGMIDIDVLVPSILQELEATGQNL